jgi:hypothetical protein
LDPCVWFDADMIETIPSRLSREGWVIPIGRIRGEISCCDACIIAGGGV